MPQPHSAKLPPPKSEDEFEDLSAEVLGVLWRCQTSRNGRRGQRQNGVDIFGQPPDLGGGYAGAQCKNTRELSIETIENEVSKARTFKPSIARFVILTSAEADVDEQEETREYLEENQPPFPVTVMYWADICRALTPELAKKYWPAWHETIPKCGPYRRDAEVRSEPTVQEAMNSAAIFRYLESKCGDTEYERIEAFSGKMLATVSGDLTTSEAYAKSLATKSDELVTGFLQQESEGWKRALAATSAEPDHDPSLELTFLGATEEAELDIGIRNLSDNDAIIDQVSITVINDLGYIAPILLPTALYQLPVGDLGVGDSRSIQIRHVVEAHRADRFLIDVEDIRTLLLHVKLRTNAGYCLSGDVWLFSQDYDDEFDDEQSDY